MQGASSSSSSSSTSLPHSWKHDVFLSFRGRDTRSGFTYSLYKALEREKVKTFYDEQKLKRGENISSALLRAIEVSRISVVICSQNYASSSWCLDELVKILQCQKSRNQIIIPVFYKVDPAHVRHQSGSFGQAFNRQLKYNMNKIPTWKAALTQLGNLSGLTYEEGYEYEFIQKIVKEILDVVGLDHQNKEKGWTSFEDQRMETPDIAQQSWLLKLILNLLFSVASVWRLFKPKRRGGVAIDEKMHYGSMEVDSNNNRVHSVQFTSSEVLKFTNNLRKTIGKGSFGFVCHGYINNTRVAVKCFQPCSIRWSQMFQAKVNLLLGIHHRNLTSLVGYFNDQPNKGLIYEYMANGNLKQHLSARSSTVLGWKDRLRIAADAAQGLEYLHHGCHPPIIHGNVKSDNILLTDNFQAKLSDFGLSRNFHTDVGTHITNGVAIGYLAPEYYITNRLNEKTDTYSFGIVLLEIITGRPVMTGWRDWFYIIDWVSLMIRQKAQGDIQGEGVIQHIVDPRLERNFSVHSASTFLRIAMACVSPDSPNRPMMSQVAMELTRLFEWAI